MDIKEILNQIGVKSKLSVGIIGAFWLIGVTPVVGGNTMPKIMHSHFLQPSSLALALNTRGDIQEIVYGYEYSLEKHINKLNDIKERYQNNPPALMIELERWKADKKKIEDKLQDWRNKSLGNRAKINNLLANS